MKAILIATGDEITQGDIVNTTGPAIANQLAEHNIEIVMHVMVPDTEIAIQTAIENALQQADLVFTTGGLGPTSDDLTRFALAKALNKPLVFNHACWQQIVDRLTGYKLHVHEDNRRQAYFPDGAKIFDNPNGTAAGCGITVNNKSIYMLPGPPNECLPMFQHSIVPLLPKSQRHKIHWLLLGASEGEIAAELDAALTTLNCQTGYRAEYPYLEVKVWTKNATELKQAETIITPLVNNYLVSKENKIASQLLQEKIIADNLNYIIYDTATAGILQSVLVTPKTQQHLQFTEQPDNATIHLTGLTTFWQDMPAPGHSDVTLITNDKTINRKLYYRNATVKTFVAEWVCWQLLQ